MTASLHTCCIDSPIGWLKLTASNKALQSVQFVDKKDGGENTGRSSILEKAALQFAAYFKGDRSTFALPLEPNGTEFQQTVWKTLSTIPYGSTITYSELAQRLGDINKVRAVGRANGQNPLPIILPCHRVIGSNNKLTGYAGGIEKKRWLLQHEGALLL